MGSLESPTPAPNLPCNRFATTQWSLVLAAGQREGDVAEDALAQLCQSYWTPLYAYARRRVTDVNEAQDLTQAFFAELLDKNFVGQALPERGRFRSFLITAFKHFLSKEWEKQRAQKRGGRTRKLSLDFGLADSRIKLEPATTLTPEQLFDRDWVIALLSQILDQLEQESDQKNQHALFDALKPALIGDLAFGYAHLAGQLQMSEDALRKAASRLRKRYRELLREEISRTVSSPEEVDQEIRNLFTSLEI